MCLIFANYWITIYCTSIAPKTKQLVQVFIQQLQQLCLSIFLGPLANKKGAPVGAPFLAGPGRSHCLGTQLGTGTAAGYLLSCLIHMCHGQNLGNLVLIAHIDRDQYTHFIRIPITWDVFFSFFHRD